VAWIAEYLKRYEGYSFIEKIDMTELDPETLARISRRFSSYWLTDWLGHGLSLAFAKHQQKTGLRRKPPDGLIPTKGPQWWILHREAVDYLRRYLDNYPAVLRYFKLTGVPDESFFHTILWNSPLRNMLVSKCLHFISRPARRSHPEVLAGKHYPFLCNSECLFARKFDETASADVLSLIDKNLLN
jgi:hypothetical protein